MTYTSIPPKEFESEFSELQELSDYQYYIKTIEGERYICSFAGHPIGRVSLELINLLKRSHA